MKLDIRESYQELPLALVDTDPNQPRRDSEAEEGLDELTASIQDNTLIQAVTVKPHPTVAGRYMVVTGERRFRAMRRLGIAKKTFKVISGPGVDKSYIVSAIENLNRLDMNPIDEALCYQRLHDEEGLKWEEIRELTGRDVGAILNKIKLLTLPPEIQDLVRQHALPQVTALNLVQWRNQQGEYLRMAHDLMAGRDPAELHLKRDSAHGDRLVQAKLPRTPEDYGRRIVNLSGRVQSMPAVLEAFLRLPASEQRAALESLHPSTLGKLRTRFTALFRATQAFSEAMENHRRQARDGPADEKTADLRASCDRPVSPAPVSDPPPIADLPPPPLPAPTSSARQPSRRERRTGWVAPHPVFAPVAANPGTAPSNGSGRKSNGQSFVVSYQVLNRLFYSGGFRHVDLSKRKLNFALGGDIDPQTAASDALAAARDRWRVAPRGGDEEQRFIRLVARFRHDFGDATNMEDCLRIAAREDRSDDPVSLGV